MRGLLVAFLVLSGSLPVPTQAVHGAGNSQHGNFVSAANDTGGHAIDSDKTVAEEESSDGGNQCVEGPGAGGKLGFYACRARAIAFGSVERTIVTFIALLALSTLLLWIYTRRVANAARVAAEHLPAVERAYVFGGPTDLFLLHDQASVRLAMQNYGKTPAVIREWLVEFVAQEPRGSRPGYDKAKRTVTNEILEPFKLFSPPTVFRSEIPAPFYIVGYIAYDDVFRQSHTTKFCVGVARDGKAAYAGHPEWNVFD
jgi:hypothetical protein